jgi:ribosomal protein L7/L12
LREANLKTRGKAETVLDILINVCSKIQVLDTLKEEDWVRDLIEAKAFVEGILDYFKEKF